MRKRRKVKLHLLGRKRKLGMVAVREDWDLIDLGRSWNFPGNCSVVGKVVEGAVGRTPHRGGAAAAAAGCGRGLRLRRQTRQPPRRDQPIGGHLETGREARKFGN